MTDRRIPIYNAIKAYTSRNPVPFHMPGHKLGRGIPAELLHNPALLDLTEIPGTDNLHYPEGVIKEAQELAAAAFGADSTFFLINGSTCGIHAMILALCKPGDKLIVGRDCHKSVINGMILAGVAPVYIKPEFNPVFGIPSAINPADVERALKENADAVGVLITRPNYYGICSDIDEIARLTHSYGKILAVDEAHGAHLRFSSELPLCALDGGADICVQSAHKTLPALTQSAYLHVRGGKIDIERLRFYLGILQTSSPSYVLMTYLDIARDIMDRSGSLLLRRLLDNIDCAKRKLNNAGLKTLENQHLNTGSVDSTRLVVNMGSTGKTGFDADIILREEYGIQAEMADIYNIVCITTVADRKEDFESLAAALYEIADRYKDKHSNAGIKVKDLKVPPLLIALKDIPGIKGRYVKLEEAAGKISKEAITPYPPGIPAVCPGEMITEDAVEYIYNISASGGIINGLSNMEICVADI